MFIPCVVKRCRAYSHLTLTHTLYLFAKKTFKYARIYIYIYIYIHIYIYIYICINFELYIYTYICILHIYISKNVCTLCRKRYRAHSNQIHAHTLYLLATKIFEHARIYIYIYMYTYIYIHTYVYIYTYIHMSIYTITGVIKAVLCPWH